MLEGLRARLKRHGGFGVDGAGGVVHVNVDKPDAPTGKPGSRISWPATCSDLLHLLLRGILNPRRDATTRNPMIASNNHRTRTRKRLRNIRTLHRRSPRTDLR